MVSKEEWELREKNIEIVQKTKEYIKKSIKPCDYFEPTDRIDEGLNYLIEIIENREFYDELQVSQCIDLIVILCGRKYFEKILDKNI